MTSRVNVKLVVALVVGLLAVGGGGVFVGLMVLDKTAAQNAAAGDKAFAEGDFALAKRMYSRAANKEPMNVEYLTKWEEAVQKWEPATETDFDNEFQTAYVPLKRAQAVAQPGDAGPSMTFLGILSEQVEGANYAPNAVENLDTETEQLLVRMQAAANGNDSFLKIRRFRGIAYSLMIAGGRVVSDVKRQLAEEDLKAALDADPKDGESAVALMRLIDAQARAARENGRREQFAQLRAEAMKILDDHLARDADDPDVLLNKLALQIDTAQEKAAEGKVGAEAIRAVTAAYRSFEQPLVELAQKLTTTDEPISVDLVRRLQMIENTVLPQNQFELSLALAENLVSQSPDDAQRLLFQATLLSGRGDYEQAARVLEKVSALPSLPVGLEGVKLIRQKTAALASRATVELSLRSSLPESEESARTAALERAKVARGEFAKRVPEDNDRLLMLDARIAEAEGDLRRAQNLLQRYNQVTRNQDLLGIWMEGQISSRLGEFGRAKQSFELIRAVEPGNVSATMMVAQMERALQNPQRALELFRELAKLNPDDETIRAQIHDLEIQTGQAQSDDPVEQVLINAQLAMSGQNGQPGSAAEAIDILKKGAAANNQSPRIALQLANYQLGVNNLSGAREAVAASLKLYPDDEQLKLVSEALKSDDTFGVTLMLIDASNASEIDKLVNKYTYCQINGRPEMASGILEELAAKAPDDPRVIELRFLASIAANDVEGARKIYQAALDKGQLQFDGLIYRARLESAAGKTEDAITTLSRAIELGANQAYVWRLMGLQQVELGRYTQAVDSFRKARDIQPNDIQNIRPLLDALNRSGQTDEALRVAREAERFGRNDPQFVNLWLQLEARAGGPEGVSRAILVREQRKAIDPSDQVNLMELASLYMDVAGSNSSNTTDAAKKEAWAKARGLIDGLKQGSAASDLRVVMLEARWFADQGRVTHADGSVTDGIDDARGIFIDYIIGLGDKVTAVPYIELARFMTQRGRYAIAKQALVNAGEYQSDQLEADKVLAALHMELSEFGDAEVLFKKIVEAGVDDSNSSYLIRWIEMMLRQGRYEEAQKQLARVPEKLQDSMTVLLQRAELADGLGKPVESGQLLDRAVTMFPQNPLPYTRRAEFRMRDPNLINDVLADLQQALKINPNDQGAQRLLAGVYGSTGRYDDMLNSLISALRANPYQDDVLQSVMVELILRKQDGRAMDVVEETMRARPRDLMLLARAGRVFDERELWQRSEQLYQRGWELSGDPGFALAYINSLISQSPPKVQIADRVLREVRALSTVDGESWQIAFADAAIRFKAGRRDDAEAALARQFGTLAGAPADLSKWWGNIKALYKGDDARLERFLRGLISANASTETAVQRTWARVFLAQVLVGSPAGQSEGFEILEDLMKLGPKSAFAMLAYRQAGSAYYTQDQYEKAVDVWKRGLDAFPGDWEMCNNAAYALATKLDRPAEALPFAKSAAEANPDQAEVYDTMARVHIAMKDLDAATENLETARQHVGSKRAETSVTLTQCELDVQNGKLAKARRVLERLLLAITPLPDLREEFEEPIRDLLRRIDSLEG